MRVLLCDTATVWVLLCDSACFIAQPFQQHDQLAAHTSKLDTMTQHLNKEIENNQLLFNDLIFQGYGTT